MSSPSQPEPAPQPGETRVLDLALKRWHDKPCGEQIQADLIARAEEGLKKYGTYLETNNGRDALMDAYQEALDLLMCLEQENAERNIRTNSSGYGMPIKIALETALFIRLALNRREERQKGPA